MGQLEIDYLKIGSFREMGHLENVLIRKKVTSEKELLRYLVKANYRINAILANNNLGFTLFSLPDSTSNKSWNELHKLARPGFT